MIHGVIGEGPGAGGGPCRRRRRRPRARGPRLRGEIVSLHPGGGYGFIQTPTLDRHVYIGRQALDRFPGALLVGDTVAFTLHTHDDDGKVPARDVRLA
jgi:hypothetical protein